MSKKSAAVKELELRQQKAETEKAELEAKDARRRNKRLAREHRVKYKYEPTARGVFYLTGRVDDTWCAYWGDQVQRYAHLNPSKPITLYIQTPGGSVLHGLGLYDTLRTISAQDHHITTVVRGYAASMGAILLQAGDTRLVGAESHIMLHEISSGAIGKLHELEDEVEFCKRLNRRLFAIVAARTDDRWEADSLYKWVKAKDRWLSADRAVAQGFADGVG